MPDFSAIEALLAQGDRLAAIKRTRELLGITLVDAKEAVEWFVIRGRWPPQHTGEPIQKTFVPDDHGLVPDATLAHLEGAERCIARGNRVGAIKCLRASTHWGLREVKQAVQAYETSRTWPAAVLAVFGDAAANRKAPASTGGGASPPASEGLQATIEQLIDNDLLDTATRRLCELTGWSAQASRNTIDVYLRDCEWSAVMLAVWAAAASETEAAPTGRTAPPPSETGEDATSGEEPRLASMMYLLRQAPDVQLAARAMHEGRPGVLLVRQRALHWLRERPETPNKEIAYHSITRTEVQPGPPAMLSVRTVDERNLRFVLSPADTEAALALLRRLAR